MNEMITEVTETAVENGAEVMVDAATKSGNLATIFAVALTMAGGYAIGKLGEWGFKKVRSYGAARKQRKLEVVNNDEDLDEFEETEE